MIKKFQNLKAKIKLKFYKNINNYYDEKKNRIFKFEEHLFTKNAHGVVKTDDEVILLMKIFQTKPQVKNMNNNYYDLFYTVNKSRD